MTIKITNDDRAEFKRFCAILDQYDVVQQQKLLELGIARHVMRFSREPSEQKVIIEGMAKHVTQFLGIQDVHHPVVPVVTMRRV